MSPHVVGVRVGYVGMGITTPAGSLLYLDIGRPRWVLYVDLYMSGVVLPTSPHVHGDMPLAAKWVAVNLHVYMCIGVICVGGMARVARLAPKLTVCG